MLAAFQVSVLRIWNFNRYKYCHEYMEMNGFNRQIRTSRSTKIHRAQLLKTRTERESRSSSFTCFSTVGTVEHTQVVRWQDDDPTIGLNNATTVSICSF